MIVKLEFSEPIKVIYYDYLEIREKPQDEWRNYEIIDNVVSLIIDEDEAMLMTTNGEIKTLSVESTALNLDEQFDSPLEEYGVFLIPKKVD